MLGFGASWTIGTCLLVLIAYLVPKWRTLGVAISLIFVFVLYTIYKCPETPRWLYSKSYTKKLLLFLDMTT